MANINYSNTVDILKAASPHVDVATKSSLELIAKLFDLMGTIQSINRPSNVAALGLNNQTFHFENLISSIRPFCSEKERSFMDRILNIFNIRKTLDMYQQYSDIFKTMPGFSGFNFNQGANDNSADDSDDEEKEPFDIEAFLKQFQADNSDNDSLDHPSHFEFDYTGEDMAFDDDGTYDPNEIHIPPSNNENLHSNFSNDNFSSRTSSDNSSNDEVPDYLQDFMDQLNKIQHKDEKPEDIIQKSTSTNSGQGNNTTASFNDNANRNSNQSNNANTNNATMMNMVKNMVPPDQMGAFQNLSMLFNTMSYTDSNNKKKDNGG